MNAAIAKQANRVARLSRNAASAPLLTETSTGETLAAWLQWCDPNGCHTAELAEIEGFEPYTPDEAWQAIALMIAE